MLIFVKTAGKPITLNVNAGDVLDMDNLIDIGVPSTQMLMKHPTDELFYISNKALGVGGFGKKKKADQVVEVLNRWNRLDTYNLRLPVATVESDDEQSEGGGAVAAVEPEEEVQPSGGECGEVPLPEEEEEDDVPEPETLHNLVIYFKLFFVWGSFGNLRLMPPTPKVIGL